MIIAGAIMCAVGLLAVMWAMAEMAEARKLVAQCKQQPRDASGKFVKRSVAKAIEMRREMGLPEWRA